MRKVIDFDGMVSGLLTVVCEVDPCPRGLRRFRCRCECGGERVAFGHHLVQNSVKTCGAKACQNESRRRTMEGRTEKQRTPRAIQASPRELECDRAVACLIASGGYGGRNDRINWRDARVDKKAGHSHPVAHNGGQPDATPSPS